IGGPGNAAPSRIHLNACMIRSTGTSRAFRAALPAFRPGASLVHVIRVFQPRGHRMPRSLRRRDLLVAGATAGAAALGLPANYACAAEREDAPDPDFHVFLAFGQSNMEGFPGIEAEDRSGVDPRLQMLAAVDFADLGRRQGEWYPAVPPLCRGSTDLCP